MRKSRRLRTRGIGTMSPNASSTKFSNDVSELMKALRSLYLHCDPTASHYLKLVLDGVFGKEHFRNEVIWKRTSSHNDASQGLSRFGRSHDVVFFYESTHHGTFPKIQILTIEGLMSGKVNLGVQLFAATPVSCGLVAFSALSRVWPLSRYSPRSIRVSSVFIEKLYLVVPAKAGTQRLLRA